MDLSKAYDCIPHDLLIAKLEAHCLDKTNSHLIRVIEYGNKVIGNRKSVTGNKGKNRFHMRDWWDEICGVLQESILGHLLCITFI